VAKLLQSLAEPFEVHRETYVRQLTHGGQAKVRFQRAHFRQRPMYRLSRCILLAPVKTFQGALVASMSIRGAKQERRRSGRLSSGLDVTW
jgi:glucoamylase